MKCLVCGNPGAEQKLRVLNDGGVEEELFCEECWSHFVEITPLLPDQTGDEPLEEYLRYIHD